MSAIPANSPIAQPRTGITTPPWLQWLTRLQAQINSAVASQPDETARELAYDAAAEIASLRAKVAMLEKRLADLEVQVPL